MKSQSWCKADLIEHGDIEKVRLMASISACCDYQGLLGQFPARPETFTTDLPLLRWEAKPDKNLRSRIGVGRNTPIIGLCCETGKVMPESNRSISSSQIERIVASTPNAAFVNLNQKPLDLPGVFNFVGTIPELASVIQARDLVLTVDTFAAHLAGSLGKRVLVLMKQKPT